MMVLKEGDQGQDVLRLQLLLNKKLKPNPGLPLNGTFEARTLEAVVRLQSGGPSEALASCPRASQV